MNKEVLSKLRKELFSPINTKEEALKKMRELAYICYFLGVSYMFIIFVNKIFILDAILLPIFGFLLFKNKSRGVSIIIFLYSIAVLFFTILNKMHKINFGGGSNIFLAIIFVIAAFRGMDATLLYHEIVKSKINIKNAIILFIIAILYSVTWIAVSLILILTLPNLQNKSEEFLGCFVAYPAVFIFIVAYLRILPFTRNRSAIITGSETTKVFYKNE